jgi:hypothetical protein
MPSIKTTLRAQNSISDRNSIINAANYLPATSVIGNDGLTFCPPRSAAASAVCVPASVALTDLANLSPSDAHLPTNYASAASTGSPYEVGIFAAGGNLPQTDSQGHYWIVCRWENPESSPTSPAFAVIGAGPDGVLQTKCGDTKASGDNLLQFVTVGAAAQRAATWNNQSNGKATFGAAGSQISVDSEGNLTASGAINAASGTFGSLSITNALTAGSVTTTGDATIAGNLAVDGTTSLTGALSGSNAAFLSALTAQTLATTGNITAGGNIGVGAPNPAAGIDVNSNAMFVARLSNSATATAQIVIQDYYGGYGARLVFFDGPTLGWLLGESGSKNFYIENTVTGNKPITDTAAGLLTLGEAGQMSLPASGGVGIGTNAPAATLDVRGTASISGALSSAALTTTGVATIGGTLNGSNAVFTGNVQAASFSGGGVSMSSGGINGSGSSTLGALTVSSLTDTGAASAASLTVSGAASTGNLTVNGSLSAGALTASSINTGIISSSGLGVWAADGNAIWAATNISEVAYFATYGGLPATIQVDNQAGGYESISFLNMGIPQWYVGSSGTTYFYIWDNTNEENVLTVLTSNGLLTLGEAGQMTLPSSGGVAIGTTGAGSTFGTLTISYDGNATNGLIFADTTSGGRTWGIGDDTGNTCSPGRFCIYDFNAAAARFLIATSGYVGIGTTSPQATLDVNGYARLAPQTSAPATCNASAKGSLAYASTAKRLCACNGSNWVFDYNNGACTW